MGDRGMRSWFFLLPAWRWRHDDDEGAALVPKEEDDQVKDTAVQLGCHGSSPPHNETTTTTTAAEAGAASSSSSRAARWWRLPATRGVGLVIGGLIVLAVLLATTTTWWPHLDYSSSSFLLGNSNNGQHSRDAGGGRRRHHAPSANLVPIPFNCGGNSSCSYASSLITGASSPAPSPASSSSLPPVVCPDYFRYIHSDLDPWRERGGITREVVESGQHRAAFRLVVVGGRAYVETYHRVFQTRDSFTQWGIAQLLARYPGRVPDLDLMFNCEDMPEIFPASESQEAPPPPPPLFRYCKDDTSLDIVFPDWSFWGWPEVNIRPWAPLLQEMAAETTLPPWPDKREPYAFWKGNPGVSPLRAQLLKCNSTTTTRVFGQDWGAAIRNGFRDSNLAKQCGYRYKIFVQGRSWSVSEKYILACDSPVLLVATPYKDFFSRGLVAGKHYWPIDPKMMCPAIDFAVHWGNAHPKAAQRMAHEGSSFAREDLSMDYVYDYMLHLLTQYASLLRYKPTVPENAVELCPETLACPAAQGREKEFNFMMESRERYVADYEPCTLPPPFTADELTKMAQNDKRVRDKVHTMMMTAHKKKQHR
ncbi:hypothetical protein EJB05_10359, partial [Eragrostis curvula]